MHYESLFFEENRVRPQAIVERGWEEAGEALDENQKRHVRGKVVLKIQ